MRHALPLLLALSCRTGSEAFDTTTPDSEGQESRPDADDSRPAESAPPESAPPDSGPQPPLVLEYPEQRVGIFYLTWHAYAAQAMAQVPATAVSADQTPMIRPTLEVYADYADGDLLLRPDPGDAPVIFVIDHDGLPIDGGLMAEIEAQGVTPVRLWGNLSAERLAAGTAGWMQPCTRDGGFTTPWTPRSGPCAAAWA